MTHGSPHRATTTDSPAATLVRMSTTRTAPPSPSTPATTVPAGSVAAGPVTAGSVPAGPVAAAPRPTVAAAPRPTVAGVPRRVLRQAWAALADAAPHHPYQRAMYGAAVLLLASGLVHVGVWAVDGGAWEGAVSWRKPILFGVSFGLFALSVGWVQGVLPRSRGWGWTTTALIAVGGVAEVALITVQQWRGVASHFNVMTPLDTLLFSLMGVTIGVFGAGIALLAVWAAIRLRRPAPTVLAVLVGLALVLVASAVGGDMITRGLAYVETTEAVPPAVVIGVAGSGKLAHAVALHGIQVLGALALLLGRSGLSAAGRTRAMLAASAGYVVLTGLVAAQAYAGRSMLELSPGMIAGLALASLAVVVPFGFALRDAVGGIAPAVPVHHDRQR